YSVEEIQKYISDNKGSAITLVVDRGGEQLSLIGTPRLETSAGQGALGISGLGEVVIVKYPFFESFWKGLEEMANMFVMIGRVLNGLLHGENAGVEVMGPVKLAIFT